MHKRRRKKEYGPVPFPISLALTFLDDEEMDEVEYEDAVRRVVREKLPTLQKDEAKGGDIWEEYDDFVSRIIEEELARN